MEGRPGLLLLRFARWRPLLAMTRIDLAVMYLGYLAIAAQLLTSAINAAAEVQRWVPGIHPGNATVLYTRPALQGLLCPN